MDEENNDNNTLNSNNSNNETNLEVKHENEELKLEEETKLNEALTPRLTIEETEESSSNEITNNNNNMKPLVDEQSQQQLTNQEMNESKQENDLVKSSTDDYSSLIKMLSDFKKSKSNEIESKLQNEETGEYYKQKIEPLNEEVIVVEEEEDDDESASNNTSYQELPSVCKSQTMADEPEDDTSKLNNSEKEDTLDQSLLRKPTPFDQSKRNLLNTSMQSMTSQCTIDSLAKRVQSLVGPIDYKKSSLDVSNYSKKDESTNLSKHSSINYESIYKELDSIQDTLRMQHSFNKHLEKLTASRAEIKDLLLNDKLSESTFSTVTKVSPLSYSTTTNSVSSIDSVKLGKDYLKNSLTKPGNYDTYSVSNPTSTKSNKFYPNNDFRTFKEDETKYFSKKINDLKTDLEALSLINNSINKDLNTTNKFTIDLKSKLSSNYLTSSLTRMTNLNDMPKTSFSNSTSSRHNTRSTFESDHDILVKNKYQFLNFNKLGKSYSNADMTQKCDETNDFRHSISSNIGLRSTQIEPIKPHSIGIYHLKDSLVKKVDKSDDKLDPEYLREMDKKLKKLIKKNLNTDLKLNSVDEKENVLAWDIEANKEANMRKDESIVSQASTSPSYGHSSPPPHPYLPLRDVPMHEIVKKLQREFELEQNDKQGSEMNKLWEEIKSKVEMKSNESVPDLNNLNNLIRNPVKTLLKSELEQPISTPSTPNVNTRSVEETSSKSKIKSLLTETSSLKLDNVKSLNKEKLKEIIEFQKQRHERRVKALEKLAKLERLQAEKLKQILQINDDMITPHMYELFIHQNTSNFLDANETIGNETIVDLDEALKDENLSMLINDDKKSNNNKKLKFNLNESKLDDKEETKTSTIEKTKSKVEVFNLKNTSVYEPPEGVCVVKETQQQMRPDARVFFTIPCDDTTMSNKKVNSKPEPLINSQQRINTNNKYKSIGNSYSNVLSKEKETKKLSLQEAFELYKYDLISRSRQRQREIQFRAEQRQRELEYEAEQIENYHKKLKDQQIKKRLMSLNTIKKNAMSSKKGLMFEINVENFMHKRPMSTQDIKKQTKKIYEKLPEVQQKQLQLRAEELKRQNRLKSNIYRKTLQQRVLTRGPNFNLREAFVV